MVTECSASFCSAAASSDLTVSCMTTRLFFCLAAAKVSSEISFSFPAIPALSADIVASFSAASKRAASIAFCNLELDSALCASNAAVTLFSLVLLSCSVWCCFFADAVKLANCVSFSAMRAASENASACCDCTDACRPATSASRSPDISASSASFCCSAWLVSACAASCSARAAAVDACSASCCCSFCRAASFSDVCTCSDSRSDCTMSCTSARASVCVVVVAAISRIWASRPAS